MKAVTCSLLNVAFKALHFLLEVPDVKQLDEMVPRSGQQPVPIAVKLYFHYCVLVGVSEKIAKSHKGCGLTFVNYGKKLHICYCVWNQSSQFSLWLNFISISECLWRVCKNSAVVIMDPAWFLRITGKLHYFYYVFLSISAKEKKIIEDIKGAVRYLQFTVKLVRLWACLENNTVAINNTALFLRYS